MEDIKQALNYFIQREEGAVTVDWLVLTLGLVWTILGAAAFFSAGQTAVTHLIVQQLQEQPLE